MFTTCTICMSPEPRASRYSCTWSNSLFLVVLDVHVYYVYYMHVSRAPSFQILLHLVEQPLPGCPGCPCLLRVLYACLQSPELPDTPAPGRTASSWLSWMSMFTTCTICMSPEPRASRYSCTWSN